MLKKTEIFLLELLRSKSKDEFKNVFQYFCTPDSLIDWQYLIDYQQKAFLPLYLKAKSFYEIREIPKDILKKIEYKCLNNAGRNTKIRNEVIKLAKDFNSEKIELLFFKGAAFLFTLYREDITPRVMADIDVMVRFDQLKKSEVLLESLEYKEDYERLSKEMDHNCSKDFFSKKHFHYVYFKGDIKLELHWRVGGKKSVLKPEILFNSIAKEPFRDAEVSVLNPETAIFLYCVDFYRSFRNIRAASQDERKRKQFYETAFYVYEISLLIGRYGSDRFWNKLYLLCKSKKSIYKVSSILFLVEKIADIKLFGFEKNKLSKNILLKIYKHSCRDFAYDDFKKFIIRRNLILKLAAYEVFLKNPFKVYSFMKEYLRFFKAKIP